MLPLQARVDLVAIAMKGYSAFPKTPALPELHHEIVLSYPWHSLRGGGGGLTLLQRCSRCILQPQQIWLRSTWYHICSETFWKHLLKIWTMKAVPITPWYRITLEGLTCRSNSPKLSHYLSLTIRLFSVISRTSIVESNPSAKMQSVYSTAPADWTVLLWIF